MDSAMVTADHLYKRYGDTVPLAVVFSASFSERVMDAAMATGATPAVVTFIVDPAADGRFVASIQGTVAGFVQQTVAVAQAPHRIEAAFASVAAVSDIGRAFAAEVEAEATVATANQGVRFEEVAAGAGARALATPEAQNVPAYTLWRFHPHLCHAQHDATGGAASTALLGAVGLSGRDRAGVGEQRGP